MLKVEILFKILLRLQFVRKKMLDQGKGQFSGLPTDIFIMVLIDYVVTPPRPGGVSACRAAPSWSA